LLIWR